MKSEPKAFASLSSGLLARKGAARPAMRPQGFGQMGAAGLDDLGWNDMGFEAPRATPSPVRDADHDAFGNAVGEPALRNPVGGLTPFSPVHAAQAELAQRFVQDAEAAGDEDLDETAETMDLAEPALQAIAAAVVTPQPKVSIVFDHSDDEDPADTGVVDFATPPADQAAEPIADASVQMAADIAAKPVAEEPVVQMAAEVAAERVVEADAEMPSEFAMPSSAESMEPARRAPRRVGPKAPRPQAAASGKAKAAFTLRLDPERHLKLRLACAITARSAQQLVTEALDAWLAEMPELDAMAKRAPERAAHKD